MTRKGRYYLISPQREYESYFRVYSTIKGTTNIRYIHFWGAFENEREAIREKRNVEDAAFFSWVVTGEILKFEKELINYRRENSSESRISRSYVH